MTMKCVLNNSDKVLYLYSYKNIITKIRCLRFFFSFAACPSRLVGSRLLSCSVFLFCMLSLLNKNKYVNRGTVNVEWKNYPVCEPKGYSAHNIRKLMAMDDVLCKGLRELLC